MIKLSDFLKSKNKTNQNKFDTTVASNQITTPSGYRIRHGDSLMTHDRGWYVSLAGTHKPGDQLTKTPNSWYVSTPDDPARKQPEPSKFVKFKNWAAATGRKAA